MSAATHPVRRRRAPGGGFLRALVWMVPAIAILVVVFGYGTFRLLVEATHRKGRSEIGRAHV